MSAFLVTGCAGFIGSNLSYALLDLGHRVVGLDNIENGLQSNVDYINTHDQKDQFTFKNRRLFRIGGFCFCKPENSLKFR